MLLARYILLTFMLLVQASWAYDIIQPEFSLQRFLDANPSQQPLMEQLSARVYSQPTPISAQATKTQKIAVVLRGRNSDLKNRAWIVAFSRRLRELDLDFRLNIFYLSDRKPFVSSVDVFYTIFDGHYDYVIMDRLDEYSRPNLERLLSQGRPKLIMLGMTAPIEAWRYHPPLIYIGIDLPKTVHRLASYINRLLDQSAVVDVVMADDMYANGQRCQVFINEWMAMGRQIRHHFSVANQSDRAFSVASKLLKETSKQQGDITRQHFIFSCTQEISSGVLQALAEQPSAVAMTNAWNEQQLMDSTGNSEHVLVTVLDMYDNMAIAASEAIKADAESRLLPDVYMESSRLLSQDMDEQTRNIMFQQAFRYSYSLWPR